MKLPHFYRKITFNTLIHSSLLHSRSFPPAPTLTIKVSNILDTAKLFAIFLSEELDFSEKDKKKASDCTTTEKIALPHSYSMTALLLYASNLTILQISKLVLYEMPF